MGGLRGGAGSWSDLEDAAAIARGRYRQAGRLRRSSGRRWFDRASRKTSEDAGNRGRRMGGFGLIPLTVVLALIFLIGILYQYHGIASDSRKFPPPGRM